MRCLCKLPPLPRWSMLVAPLLYLIFVLFVLNLTFPLSSLMAPPQRGAASGASVVATANRSGNADAAGVHSNDADDGDGDDDASNAVVAYKVEPKRHTYEELRTLKESFYK